MKNYKVILEKPRQDKYEELGNFSDVDEAHRFKKTYESDNNIDKLKGTVRVLLISDKRLLELESGAKTLEDIYYKAYI